MSVTTLKLAGREFVILAKKDYLTLRQRANGKSHTAHVKRPHRMSKQDRGDVAEVKRMLADPKLKFIPWEEARKRLA